MHPQPLDPIVRWPGVLFGAALILILGVCLFPYQLQIGSGRSLSAESVNAERGVGEALRDIVVNVLLFFPLGVGMAATAEHRLGLSRHAVLTLTAAAALSLGVEGLQMLLPSRHPSLRDVAANVGGAVLGRLLFVRRRNQAVAMCLAVRTIWRRLWRIEQPGRLLCIYVVFALLLAGSLQASTRLSNWSTEFPLLIGNEGTGDRPWAGWVRVLEISNRALGYQHVAAALGTNLEQLLPDSWVLSLHFPDSQLPPTAIGAGFTWQDLHPQLPALISRPGVFLSGSRWLRSDKAGGLVGDALRRTNQLTLKLVCRTASAHQKGPSRIVSVSTDPYHRNLTIGQEGPDLIVRLRTPITGQNGREPELVKPNVFDRDIDSTILITYDGATLTAYVNGPSDANRLEFSPGAVLASSLFSPSTVDLPGYTLLFLVLLSSPAGVLFVLTLPRRLPRGPGPMLAVAGLSVLFSGGVELLLVLLSGRIVDCSHLASGAIVCSLAGLIGLHLRPHAD